MLCHTQMRTALHRGMVRTRSATTRAAATQGAAAPMPAPARVPVAAASGIPFDDVHNLRDLSEVDPAILPGRVFRSAAPVYASSTDIQKLYNDLAIKELIDLRSSDELQMLHEQHFAAFDGVSFCGYTRDNATKRAIPDPASTTITDSEIMRVHIPPLEKRRLYKSILGRMPLRTAAYVLLTSLIDKEAGRAAAIQEVNAGGLEGLYEILLDGSKPEWVAALQRLLVAAEEGRPVLFFCKAGKDRTGILAALLLSILGATEDQIIADYIKSDDWHHMALAGLENDSRIAHLDRSIFERAPAKAMRHALRYIRETAGSVEGYLLEAGLTAEEMARLRAALLKPSAAVGAPHAKL